MAPVCLAHVGLELKPWGASINGGRQTENPHAGECWTAMEEAVKELKTAVETRDRDGFCKVVRAAWPRHRLRRDLALPMAAMRARPRVVGVRRLAWRALGGRAVSADSPGLARADRRLQGDAGLRQRGRLQVSLLTSFRCLPPPRPTLSPAPAPSTMLQHASAPASDSMRPWVDQGRGGRQLVTSQRLARTSLDDALG